MNWNKFLSEGEKAVRLIREGLKKRNINAGESIITPFKTDEDIPIYNETGEKLFWISVKTVSGYIKDPIRQMPSNYQGWMCGEVESKQWINPPAVIIWYCLNTNTAWGTITPKRLSTKWIIFPDRYGKVIDKRKTNLTGKIHYLYPSYCVPTKEIINKQEVINYIQKLSL
ncbi:hypothetical protein [Crocosphaera sp.]|uniref:hypothetical protein n=1 Tax=Crocosphaera sp. TaxID=2729996 RepID=UPI00260F8F1E|nr:hypothetical protein [Crocosphaera sp.]MDJ0578584.1 hypothetical protein [Crocosphaera sp.]